MCQSFRCCKSPTKRTRHGHHLRCTRMRHGGKGKCNVNLSHQKGLMWLSNKMESLTPSLWHLLIRNMNHSFGNGDFVWSWLYSTYKITVIRFICVYIYIYTFCCCTLSRVYESTGSRPELWKAAGPRHATREPSRCTTRQRREPWFRAFRFAGNVMRMMGI